MDEEHLKTHRGRVDAILAALADVSERAGRAAVDLSEDGAQPHFVAALTTAETTLRAQQRRLAESVAQSPGNGQQSLSL